MKILEERSGKPSGMRIGMFSCIAISGYLGIAGLHLGASIIELTGICAMFLSAGIGGKVYQKNKEQ
jgi:hypothetical protein